MGASVFDGVKGAIDIEKGDIRTLQHDTGDLPGR